MPNRILREGILTSEPVCSLGWAEEVFYRRLMSVVDDYGRYYSESMLLRAACYPRQLDKVSDADIGKWIRATEEAGLVSVYPATDGKRYLQLLNFKQQVRAKDSKFAAPVSGSHSTCVADAQHPLADAHLDVVVSVVEVVDESPRKRGARNTLMPSDFGVSERVRAWAASKGHTNLDKHLDHFRLTASAKGYTYADWDSAFMRAVSDNWAKLAAPSAASQPGGGRKELGK